MSCAPVHAPKYKLKSPKDTGTAISEHGGEKVNSGLFLDNVYEDRNISDILRINRKIFNPDILDELIKFNSIFIHFMKTAYSYC